ncbi:MAG: HIT family protein [Mycoplasmataceae bacterium]|jgi:histidine triad (HIT) family protein|nr:HIT family protein [Mycoplasmataceae bacterium]
MLKKDCLFCQIISRTIPSKIVYEDDDTLAFLDINPTENGHILIIPKVHFDNFSSTPLNYLNATVRASLAVVALLKKKLNPDGFNYLSNENEIAGQVINHFHLHIIPRFSKDNKMSKKLDVEEVYKILTK